jgi:hypothetical protein
MRSRSHDPDVDVAIRYGCSHNSSPLVYYIIDFNTSINDDMNSMCGSHSWNSQMAFVSSFMIITNAYQLE